MNIKEQDDRSKMLANKRSLYDLISKTNKCILCVIELKTDSSKKCSNCQMAYCEKCYLSLVDCKYCDTSIKNEKGFFTFKSNVLFEEERRKKQKTNEKFTCDCKQSMLYKEYKIHIPTCNKLQIKCIKCNFSGLREKFKHRCEIEIIKLNFNKLDSKLKETLISVLMDEMDKTTTKTTSQMNSQNIIETNNNIISNQKINNVIFTGDNSGKIKMLELESGRVLKEFKSLPNSIICMLPFLDNNKKLKVLASVTFSGLNVLDVESGNFTSLKSTAVAKCFSTVKIKDKIHLIIGYDQGFVEIWSVEKFEMLFKFHDQMLGNKNVFVVSSSLTENAFKISSSSLGMLKNISVNIDNKSSVCTSSNYFVENIQCSINGKLGKSDVFYVGLSNNRIEVRSENNLIQTLIGHKTTPFYLKYLNKYKNVEDVLVSVSECGELIIWNIKSTKEIYSKNFGQIFKKQSPITIHHNINSDELIIYFVSEKNALLKISFTDYNIIQGVESSCGGLTCIYSINKET